MNILRAVSIGWTVGTLLGAAVFFWPLACIPPLYVVIVTVVWACLNIHMFS